MTQNPVRHRFQRHGRYRFVDFGVLAGAAGLAGLEQLVQLWQLHDGVVSITALFQSFRDRRQIFLRRHLKISLAVNRQHRAGDLRNAGAGLYIRKKRNQGVAAAEN